MTTGKKPSRKKLAPALREIASTQDYPALLAEVKARIQSAQYAALRAVNKELVSLYWDIGRLIVERQQSEGWGKAVVERLAADLQAAFPGTGGFSASNLWRMKSFFETYSEAEKLAPLVREIGWSHNLLILSRCKDAQERQKDENLPIATSPINRTLSKVLTCQPPSPTNISCLLKSI